jgi:hypothetical protein
MTELDCGVATPETSLQRKQEAMRARQQAKPKTRLAYNVDEQITKLLTQLDGVTRADLREKLGPALISAVAYDDGVILDPAATPRQKRESADTLYRLFLNLVKADADIRDRRNQTIACKAKYRAAAAAKIKATAEKNRTALQIARRRRQIQRVLDKAAKEGGLNA